MCTLRSIFQWPWTKPFGGSTCIVFLGMMMDTIKQVIMVPQDKKDRALVMLQNMLGCKKTTVLRIQQLAGLLNYLCKAIFPARAFTHRMYSKIKITALNLITMSQWMRS